MNSGAQTRLDNAIRAHDRADAEVERLCNIIERASEALKHARETKRIAQKELDEAAAFSDGRQLSGGSANGGVKSGGLVDSAKKNSSYSSRVSQDALPSAAQHRYAGSHRHDEHDDEESEDYEESEDESESGSEYSDEEEEGEENQDDVRGFDMGNEALDQIRYRLSTSKIDPNSPEGTRLLDELLIRLQNTQETTIGVDLVNELIDDLMFGGEEQSPSPLMGDGNGDSNSNDGKESSSVSASALENNEHSSGVSSVYSTSQYPRIRINRGGKVLGWYQGQLDKRGYAREGVGSMYYDAGHECHGNWRNDEMFGRGVYIWADGHIYDGEWSNGKRHGLGKFIRPDKVILVGRYEKGRHRGEGIRWSADRKEAQSIVDGVPRKSVSLAKAEEIAKKLGFDGMP